MRRICLSAACAAAVAFGAFGALPEGYQAVEWIESHGKEGIDLGFSPPKAGGTAIDIDFEMKSSDAKTRQTVCACGMFDFSRYLFMSQNGSVYFNLSNLSTPYVKDQRIRFTADTAAKYTLSLDGVESKTGTGGLVNNSYPGNLTLFNCGGGNYGYVRLYSASFATNGIVDGVSTVLPVRNLVASVRKSDMAAGLYDLVEGKFYENDKSGAFTHGEERSVYNDVFVRGDPVNCCVPTPSFGRHGGYVAGQEYAFSIPRVGEDADGVIRGTCIGYTVYTNGIEYLAGSFDETTGDTCSFAYVHRDCDYGAEVVWHFDENVECKVSAAVDNAANGTVSKDYEWCRVGETFTVKASPSAGHVFYRWVGSDGVVYGRDPELNLTVRDRLALTAEFGTLTTLSPSDDDTTAILTAIGDAPSGSTISLGAGTYNITDTIVIGKSLSIIGADRDTTIVKGNGAVRLFKIDGEGDSDAVIANLTMRNGYDSTGWGGNAGEGMTSAPGGGAVWLNRGGMVTNCVVEECSGRHNGGAHGIHAVGGKVVDTVIRNLSCANTIVWGHVLIAEGGALVSHCVISNCTETSLTSGVVSAPVEANGAGTEIRNCLITDCRYGYGGAGQNANGMGIYFRTAGAKVVSTTITGNKINSPKGYAVYGAAAGTLVNCIVAGNVVNVSAGNPVESDIGGSVTSTYTASRPQPSGTGNVLAPDTLFKAGTFELASGSPMIGAGEVETWMEGAVDLKGADRLRDGVVDLGAYAYVPPTLACSISCAGDKKVLNALDATITSSVEGKADEIAYSWKVNGAEAGTDASFNLKTSVPGTYSVVLNIENDSGDMATSEPIVFTVVPSTIYVNAASAEPVAPYGDPNHAAATIQAAVEVAMDDCTVVVAPGTNKLDKTLHVASRLKICSSGTRDDTVIYVDGSFPGVSLEAEGTEFFGFTVEHGYMSRDQYDSGNQRGGANLYAGPGTLVHDCRFADGSCYGHDPIMGGTSLGVYNATVRDCEIVNNTRSNRGTGWQMYRGAVQVSGANSVVERCLIEGNVHVNAHRNSGWRCVAGLYLIDGLVRNCLFRNNGLVDSATGSSNERAAAAYVAGGTLENCTFVSNTIARAGTDTPPAGVYANGGTVRNCIIWDNVSSAGDTANWGGTDADFSYCCTQPALTDEHSFSSDPLFRDPAACDGVLRTVSPCARKGLFDADWMAEALDFYGKPMAYGTNKNRVGMGCSAVPVASGLTIFIQ